MFKNITLKLVKNGRGGGVLLLFVALFIVLPISEAQAVLLYSNTVNRICNNIYLPKVPRYDRTYHRSDSFCYYLPEGYEIIDGSYEFKIGGNISSTHDVAYIQMRAFPSGKVIFTRGGSRLNDSLNLTGKLGVPNGTTGIEFYGYNSFTDSIPSFNVNLEIDYGASLPSSLDLDTVKTTAEQARDKANSALSQINNNTYGLSAINNKLLNTNTKIDSLVSKLSNIETNINNQVTQPFIYSVRGKNNATATITDSIVLDVSVINATHYRINNSSWHPYSRQIIVNALSIGINRIELEFGNLDAGLQGEIISTVLPVFKLP